jgi:tripartite ATP-independent transporter DctP family solute receptor
MKRRGGLAILGVLLGYLMFLLLSAGSVHAAKTLRYAHNNTPTQQAGRFAITLAEQIKQKTNGEITVQLFPSSQLGNVYEMIDGVKVGTIDINHTDFSAYARYYDDLAVYNAAYLYRDVDHALKATSPDHPLMAKMSQQLAARGAMRILGNQYYGVRLLTANIPVKKPDDLRGKKIRAVPIPIYITMIEGMGAIPTPVDFAELPTALATGVVDGQENPLSTIFHNKFYQMQKFVMLTNHMIAFNAVVISEKTWQGLTDLQRNQLTEAAIATRTISMKETLQEESELLAKLKGLGMKAVGPEDGLDVQAFRQRVLDQTTKKFPQWADYIKQIQEIR